MTGLFEKFGKEFQPNQIIFCEFEPGNDFYLIQSGRVKISKIVKDKEKTMDILGPGDIFGEMAILEEQPRSASAIAVDHVSVLHFNRENFVTLMTAQPQLAYKLLVVFTKRIYDAKRRLMILLLDDAQAKVADVFLMLTEKEPNHEQLKEAVLNITVDDVAHWAGEPVENVQDVINHWVKVGKLELYPDKIVILNLNDFRRLVNTKRKGQRQL
ncbi:MAG: Crp/Fnr family transcriptional regulator [Candidatus Hydrogenedentota bacterium]|nr:MAG: Crp/Fnr family transcriptional regulator [Candidatus Hydrogenedentota bacterium]